MKTTMKIVCVCVRTRVCVCVLDGVNSRLHVIVSEGSGDTLEEITAKLPSNSVENIKL